MRTNVAATFSEEMDPETLSGITMKLIKNGTTTPVPATVLYDPGTRTVTLNPQRDLRPGATYKATVTTGARDAAGNPLAQDKTWSFRVRR